MYTIPILMPKLSNKPNWKPAVTLPNNFCNCTRPGQAVTLRLQTLRVGESERRRERENIGEISPMGRGGSLRASMGEVRRAITIIRSPIPIIHPARGTRCHVILQPQGSAEARHPFWPHLYRFVTCIHLKLNWCGPLSSGIPCKGTQDKELGITTLARSGFIKQLICIYEYAMLPSASTKHRAVQALTEMLPLEKTATLSCGKKILSLAWHCT